MFTKQEKTQSVKNDQKTARPTIDDVNRGIMKKDETNTHTHTETKDYVEDDGKLALSISISVALVCLIVFISVVCFKKRKTSSKEAMVDVNPDYGFERESYSYGETHVTDSNDYYAL